jgi:hypothetical protein
VGLENKHTQQAGPNKRRSRRKLMVEDAAPVCARLLVLSFSFHFFFYYCSWCFLATRCIKKKTVFSSFYRVDHLLHRNATKKRRGKKEALQPARRLWTCEEKPLLGWERAAGVCACG